MSKSTDQQINRSTEPKSTDSTIYFSHAYSCCECHEEINPPHPSDPLFCSKECYQIGLSKIRQLNEDQLLTLFYNRSTDQPPFCNYCDSKGYVENPDNDGHFIRCGRCDRCATDAEAEIAEENDRTNWGGRG